LPRNDSTSRPARYRATVRASGNLNPSLSETGALPAGVTLNDLGNGTASLTGTPLTSGTTTVTLSASNLAGTASQTFTLIVNAAATPIAPTLTSGNTTAFTVGQAGTFTVISSGNPTPSLSESGSLPAGVTLNDLGNGTATLTGTPLTSGTTTVTISASNSAGNTSKTFTVIVNAAAPNAAPTMTSGNTTAFTVGQAGAASMRSFLALPPWIIFMYRAWPRTKGMLWSSHRSASQYQANMHSQPTTRPAGVVEDVGEQAPGVQIDPGVESMLLVEEPHRVPPWRRAVLSPHRGCRRPARRLKLPRWDRAPARDPVLPLVPGSGPSPWGT
jgi:hypothetical protein